MVTRSRQLTAIGVVALLALSVVAGEIAESRDRVIDASFWFEPVTYGGSEAQADRLGGSLTPQELKSIESIAFSEVTRAFEGFRVSFSHRRDATYRMRVVQSLRSFMFPKGLGPSGESRAISGLGGQGAVNFRQLANNAIAYSPLDADRRMMIEAIGRGIGRAAVHEFAHQFLGTAPIHHSKDLQSYEYRSADRREQYYGDLRWDVARPLLEKRIGIAVGVQSITQVARKL